MVNSVEEGEQTGARMDDASSIGSWVDDVEEEEQEQNRRSRAFSQTSSSSDQVLSSSNC